MHKIDYDINTDFFETVYNPVKPIKTEFARRRFTKYQGMPYLV